MMGVTATSSAQGILGSWLRSVSLGGMFVALVTALLIPLGLLIVHRLYLHPLRNIPGPRLAAVTDLYGLYHNLRGGYSKQFLHLHRKYNSPVVRIGPDHVHVNSLDLYEEAFSAGSEWHKDPSFYKYFGGVDAMIAPHQYRTYRNHFAPLYSARGIESLAPRLLMELQVAAKQMQASMGADEAVNVTRKLRVLSADIILNLLFSHDVILSEWDGYHPFLQAFESIMEATWVAITWPFGIYILALIPGTGYGKVAKAFDNFTKFCEGWANEDQRIRSSGAGYDRDSHMKRYVEIDPSDEERVKIVPHPSEDVFNFVSGGTDTTAYTTACAFHYILASPGVLSKLQIELDRAAPFIRGSFDSKKIQSLPYLNAVVKEALRISSPVPGCTPRIVPPGGASIGSTYLPPGTVVSITALSVHQNEDIFPSPEKFIPERWLGEEGRALDKWNVAFSKGPRQCPGTNLANMEVRCCIAYFFSHFDFALSGNPADTLEWVDRFVAANIHDVKVKVVRDRWAQGI